MPPQGAATKQTVFFNTTLPVAVCLGGFRVCASTNVDFDSMSLTAATGVFYRLRSVQSYKCTTHQSCHILDLHTLSKSRYITETTTMSRLTLDKLSCDFP
jgi:hypothetical protein